MIFVNKNKAKKPISFTKTLIATAFLALILMPSLTACKKKATQQTATETQNKTKILATFYPLYVMLLNITEGTNTEVSMIAPANTGCLHDYQLTTKDMQAIEKCDILVANGAGMEDFLEKALEVKKESTIIASQGYNLIEENPHIWVSPSGAIWQVKQIAEGLKKLDPENASAYEKNAASYAEKIQELSDSMHSELQGLKGRSVNTFHEAFPYFSSEFGLNTVAVVEREPGTEPSARELADLVALIKDAKTKGSKVPMLFAEPQYSSSAAEVIANETGIKVQELDPAVTGPFNKKGTDSDALQTKESYLNAMRKNLDVLKSNLED
ncbi:MAG: zinc ABC transporter substrate-binding protein [Treponema sp.]|nr:zinc ABC transporter substrate-binding protein [Treponema sp.]